MQHPTVTPIYDLIGHGYTLRRQADPRIAAAILEALGPAQCILNVGAGAGSYEPSDRWVVAVEPATLMISQRPPASAEVVQARAEALPFASKSFDATMAILSVHHWQDQDAGFFEVRRVTRDRVVLLVWEPGAGDPFWLVDEYFPELGALDRESFASPAHLAGILGPLEPMPFT